MNKINFENAPSTNTPLSAENLNQMQANMEEIGAVVSATEPTTNEKVWFRKSNNKFNVLGSYVKDGDAQWTITVNGIDVGASDGNAYNIMYDAKYENEGNYVLSFVNTRGRCRPLLRLFDVNGNNLSNISIAGWTYNAPAYEAYYIDINATNVSIPFTLPSDVAYFKLGFVATGYTVTNILLSNTNIEYEPYAEQAIYTKNLNGIFEPFANIEAITNENGTAIKHSSGTMICTGQLLVETQSNVPVGSAYYSYVDVSKPFPYAFAQKPRISVDSVGDYWAVVPTAQTNTNYITSMGIITFTPDTEVRPYVFDYIAIGRWK